MNGENKNPNASWALTTKMVHEGPSRSAFGETAEALYMTSGFVYENAESAEARFKGEEEGYIYARYGNPTVSMFESRLAAMEGTERCIATASGMSAVHAALSSQLQAGDHIVASRVLFGSCLQIVTNILPRFGVDFTLVDGRDLAQWRAAVRPETKVLFCETPANPTLDLVDLEAVAAIAHEAGACLLVDNAFASPVVQPAAQIGADLVMYSATKHIDGQGRCLGGAVCCSQDFFEQHLQHHMRHIGPGMSPFNAWVLGKSMETLELRVERMANSAAKLADFLHGHGQVKLLAYPGHASHRQYDIAKRQMRSGGTLVSFEVEGGKAKAFDVLNSLNLIKISNNLGDAKSLATHPATTTHRTIEPDERAKIGIGEGLIRLSVGLEDPEDLIKDLEQAL